MASRGPQDSLIRYIMLVRMLRVLRILADIDRFSVVFQCFISLVPMFSSLVVVLFTIMYSWAQLGVSLFGGRIYRGAWSRNSNQPGTF
eukprot:SAG22_NODE_432_length_10559_cov_29.404225_10_plen_88_part_00